MLETPESQTRTRRKTTDSYEPVVCKKCKQELFQLVSVVVRCPLGWHNLTKEGLRHRSVSIQGAQWEDTQWFCGCTTPSPRSKVGRHIDTRLQRAGERWAKGHIPKDKDPKELAAADGAKEGDLPPKEKKRRAKVKKKAEKRKRGRPKKKFKPAPKPPKDPDRPKHGRKLSGQGIENLYAWFDAGVLKTEIARRLGVNWSAVEYHLKKRAKLVAELELQARQGPPQ